MVHPPYDKFVLSDQNLIFCAGMGGDVGAGGCVGRRVAVGVAGSIVGVAEGVDVGKTTIVLVGVGCGVSVGGAKVWVAVGVNVAVGIEVGLCILAAIGAGDGL